MCQSPASGAQVAAAEVRARYEALLRAPREAEAQAAGRMLLMGFNGLFAAVELRARELADHLAAPTPSAWRKIDHVNDAMHMSVSSARARPARRGRAQRTQRTRSSLYAAGAQAAMQSPALRAVLEDIFVVRRVQTAGEVLAACAQLAAAHRGAAPPLAPDDAQLARPVRRLHCCLIYFFPIVLHCNTGKSHSMDQQIYGGVRVALRAGHTLEGAGVRAVPAAAPRAPRPQRGGRAEGDRYAHTIYYPRRNRIGT